MHTHWWVKQALFIKKVGLALTTVLIVTLMWNSSSFPSPPVPFIFYWVLKNTCSIHNSSASVWAVIVCPPQGRRKANDTSEKRNVSPSRSALLCKPERESEKRSGYRTYSLNRLFSSCPDGHLWGASTATSVDSLLPDERPGQGQSMFSVLPATYHFSSGCFSFLKNDIDLREMITKDLSS